MRYYTTLHFLLLYYMLLLLFLLLLFLLCVRQELLNNAPQQFRRVLPVRVDVRRHNGHPELHLPAERGLSLRPAGHHQQRPLHRAVGHLGWVGGGVGGLDKVTRYYILCNVNSSD